MKLKLHIGTEKTGTTTVQNWFAANRDSLQSQGIYYPKSLGKVNHHSISVFAGNTSRLYQRKNFSDDDYQKYKSNLIRDFNHELTENAKIETWVISNEHLHSRLVTVEMVKEVKKFFGNAFEEIEVLIHLRPQVDVAVSHASTAARTGTKIDSNKFLNRRLDNPYYNYNLLVQRWETVFGADHITILPFKLNPCMTSFLISKLNIETHYCSAIERKNESLDYRSMALINSIPALRTHENYQIFIDDLPNSEKLSIGLDIAKQFQSVFNEDNEALINRRQDLSPGDLTPDWSRYDIPANIHHLDNYPIFVEQLNYLVMRFNWELKLEQCNTKLAEYERDLGQEDSIASRRLLKMVKATIKQIPENEITKVRLYQIKERLEKLMKKK